jgi:hypothetical protein
MSYTITVNITTQNNTASTVPVTSYVYGLDTNPTTIEEGGTATLDFVADGVYFMFLKAKALAAKVSGATSTSWLSADPFTTGKLVISNPTDNVVINIIVKVGAIPQEVARPFLIKKNFPVDTRLVLSKKEMCNILDVTMPDTYFALCKDDGHFYLYNKAAAISEETGKFTIISEVVEPMIINIDGGEILE